MRMGRRLNPPRLTERADTTQGEAKLTRLKDKVCLITGGAGSLGMASARLFLDEGTKVMLVDLN
jgi:FlaA1/EpsC-like NDP-sugar epimerase